jgi:CRP-like cAMP-binding protein
MLPGTPDSRWRWEAADTELRSVTPDGHDPFTFAHLFKQRLTVELAVDGDSRRAARQSTEIDVFDIGRVGSLYDRLITQLVSMDTQAQAKARGLKRVYHAYHPWYPVLAIGLTKAKLYLRAVQEDAYWQRRNLADPGWLMRVGVYLEFLTFLGIAEAVKDEFPNLLSATERRCFEESVAFEEIRRRIDTQAWRQAWNLHGIVFAGNPMTAAGPVDFRNLFQKETANLAFLEAHHADLKHAVELAGPNLDSAQQTWHHVYRAAERAVLNASATVFPEFRHLGATYQHFVLWHERGKFPVGKALLPPWLTAAVGDRDGVYPTAARRYRDSMNEVAEWARERGLMDYSGDECVPRTASLIESQLEGENERYIALQVMDGFRQPMETAGQQDEAGSASPEVVVGMLRAVEIFEPLTVSEIWQLAHRVEHRAFEPGEDVLVQGYPTSSLNIIERGSVDVLVRQEDGTVLPVDRMGTGDVFGEFALLTGQAVSATVRALDTIIVHQIPKSALQPIIEARPELVVELCVMLANRRVNRRTKSEDYLFGSSGPSDAGTMGRMVSRVRDYLLG